MIDRCDTDTDFSAMEIKQTAQLKRFNEWLQADSTLRRRLNDDDGLTPEQEEWLKKIGVDIDINDMSFFWKYPVEIDAYLILAANGQEGKIQDELKEIADKYPLLELWGKYSKSRGNPNALDQWLDFESIHIKFNAWRKRRMSAVKSELGLFGVRIGHPVFAFELNEGCSVGCWFCSFAANKLSATLDYPQKRGEALSIVRQCCEIFGREMIPMSLPYYRTEPHDNPHYIDFLKDFEKETGAVLCTSTAVCNDIDWVKDLLNYYQKREDGSVYCWPRLSILSLEALRKIHTSFTPLEIMDMELLIQVKDHVKPKVTGGRILKEQAGLREVEDFSTDRGSLAASVPQGTIACVSGFNINLATRSIMIFSPCYTSNKWPHGFRVYGSAVYTDENDFSEVIKGLVERSIFLSPPKDAIIKFRDDIVFRPTETGFDLATPNQLHHFKGKDKCGPLGQLIAEGSHTYAQISEILIKEHKVNPVVLSTVVRQFFDDGFIDEVYTAF
jgi:radical SAM family RiPP maturation amino acid epimerase